MGISIDFDMSMGFVMSIGLAGICIPGIVCGAGAVWAMARTGQQQMLLATKRILAVDIYEQPAEIIFSEVTVSVGCIAAISFLVIVLPFIVATSIVPVTSTLWPT